MNNRITWVVVLLAMIILIVACDKKEEATAETKKQTENSSQKNETIEQKQGQGNETVAVSSGAKGQEIYQNNCSECHKTGVAGAPKIGDRAAWEDRIAKGRDKLVQSVINGKGNMPPKAGSPALSEAEIRAAVDYIISQVHAGS